MQTYLQSKGAQRKKKHDTGGGGKDVTIYITEERLFNTMSVTKPE